MSYLNYQYYLEGLIVDYKSYLEALEHSEDGEYQEYDWCNPSYAKNIMGREIYDFVIKASEIVDSDPELYKKMEKELLVRLKLKEMEQDFV